MIIPKTSNDCSFLGVVNGRKVETPKTSSHARFRGWWWLEKGQNPENEHDGLVFGDG